MRAAFSRSGCKKIARLAATQLRDLVVAVANNRILDESLLLVNHFHNCLSPPLHREGERSLLMSLFLVCVVIACKIPLLSFSVSHAMISIFLA